MKKLLLALGAIAALSLMSFAAFAAGPGPAPATFFGLRLDNGTKTATAVSGAATLNKASGVVTSESLSTAAGAQYTLTITDSAIAATDLAFASVQLGTATTGTPAVVRVTPAAGSLVVILQNVHASAALNGTVKVSFFSLKL